MILLLALLLQAGPVERYLAEKDPAARAKILAEIKMPLAEVEAELRRPPTRPAAEGGRTVKKKLKADHPLGVDFEYVLWVPEGYDPAKSYRLIVSLHGSSGTGDAFLRNWLAEVKAAGDTFLLCPTAGRGGWGRSLLGHRYVLDSLNDVLKIYAVDRDRMFLDGASMGGNGSFELVCQYPDLFAGAAPRSGGPMFRYIPTGPGKDDKTVTAEGIGNLEATPIYWIVGEKDAKVPNEWIKTAKAQMEALKLDFVFREIPGGGHEWFPKENGAVLEWMGTRRRDAAPPRVGIETQERRFNRAFWLEIAEFRGKELLKRGFMDTEAKTIEDRMLFQDEIRVRGELRRDANEIRITASGAREIKVYVNEKMVEFAKPVRISVNGTVSTHTVKPSLETLLESARRDRGLLYTASVKVKVP